MRRALEAAAIALAVWLLYSRIDPPVHVDTARDLLIARDCADGIACWFRGPPASFAGLVQGGAWIHLLVAARGLHLSAGALAAFVSGLTAASVAVFYLALSREGLPARAVLTAVAAYAFAMPAALGVPVLWNRSPIALPAVAFFVATRAAASSRSPVALAAATVALAALVDMHLVSILLAAPLVALVLAGPPPPRAALHLLGCAVLGGGLLALSSRGAIAHDAATMARHPAALALSALVFTATCAVLTRRWRRDLTPARVTLETVVAYGGLLVLGGLAGRQWPSFRYWAPVVPFFAFGLACAIAHARPLRRGAAWLVVAGAIGVPVADFALNRAAAKRAWTLEATERCAGTLAAGGWTAEAATRAVDAAGGRAFVSTLAAFLPLHRDGADPARVLLVRGADGCRVLAPPVVDVPLARRCIGEVCARLRLHSPAETTAVGFSALAYPRRWESDPPAGSGQVRVSYVFQFLGSRDPSSVVARGDAWTRWGGEKTRWDLERRGPTLVASALLDGSRDDDGWPPAILPVASE